MIAIIDYQMGNLRSVQKGFERMGHTAEITGDPVTLGKAEKLVLPGVGAFSDAIAELHRRELVSPITDAIAAGKPMLGICLGLQLLFEVGYEDGQHEGLGVLKGEVVRFEIPHGYKVPHMGWNQVTYQKQPPIFAGIPNESHFYFVHSYHVKPADQSVIAGTAAYPDPFCAMIWQQNLFATQFHPEKSQELGLRVLKNFAEYEATC